jgi:hypothetical protein
MMPMSIQEIEQAITQLPQTQLNELVAWLNEYHHRVWDQQIEEDLDAGRLDSVIAAAEREYLAGLARPL